MVKRLRILAGFHAGASIDLTPGCWHVARDRGTEREEPLEPLPECDRCLVLIDGPDTPIEVLVSDDGAAKIRLGVEPEQHWADFEPRSAGQAVICLGDSEASWPNDLELLRKLIAPNDARDQAPVAPVIQSAWWLWICVGSLLAMGATLTLHATPDEAELSAPPVPLEEQLASVGLAQKQMGLSELRAVRVGDGVVVEGWVPTLSTEAKLNKLLDRMRVPASARHWGVAAQLQEAIEGAVNRACCTVGPSAHVDYLGEGRFAVRGLVSDPALVERRVALLRTDLADQVSEILVELEAPAAVLTYSAINQTPGAHYAQRPDGTKEFGKQ